MPQQAPEIQVHSLGTDLDREATWLKTIFDCEIPEDDGIRSEFPGVIEYYDSIGWPAARQRTYLKYAGTPAKMLGNVALVDGTPAGWATALPSIYNTTQFTVRGVNVTWLVTPPFRRLGVGRAIAADVVQRTWDRTRKPNDPWFGSDVITTISQQNVASQRIACAAGMISCNKSFRNISGQTYDLYTRAS